MARTDPLGNRCYHCVRVHVRSVVNVGIDIAQAIRNAQKIYGDKGIFFEVISQQSIMLNTADFGRLSVVNGQCQWNQESPEQADLFSRVNSFDMLGVTAVFVKGIQTLSGPLNGCAGHANWRAGVMMGSACTPWTLAHEVGHVLLGASYSPVHTNSPNNIMFASSAVFTQASNPSLDSGQVTQMLRSQYVRPC
jgi:hypothetical protein